MNSEELLHEWTRLNRKDNPTEGKYIFIASLGSKELERTELQATTEEEAITEAKKCTAKYYPAAFFVKYDFEITDSPCLLTSFIGV